MNSTTSCNAFVCNDNDNSKLATFEDLIKTVRVPTANDACEQAKFLNLSQLRNVGKVFETYLILEKENFLFFVDQFAAHEILLYKGLVFEYQAKKINLQNLLIPYVFSVSNDEFKFLCENLNIFKSLGFEIISSNNNVLRIISVPACIAGLDLKIFISYILKEICESSFSKPLEISIIAKIACRTAVKAEDCLNDKQIEVLKKYLSEDESLKCPHGKQVAVKVLRGEIEKWFKELQ